MTLIPTVSAITAAPKLPDVTCVEFGLIQASSSFAQGLLWLWLCMIDALLRNVSFIFSCPSSLFFASIDLFGLSLFVPSVNSERKADSETTITATLASAWRVKMLQGISTKPLARLDVVTLIMLMTIMTVLRQRIPPRISFWRRRMWMRQRRITGMDMTYQRVVS